MHKLHETEPTVKVLVTITSEDREMLDDLAHDHRMSRSAMARQLIRQAHKEYYKTHYNKRTQG